MAQELKHCKTHVLEGSSMAVGGEGAAVLAPYISIAFGIPATVPSTAIR